MHISQSFQEATILLNIIYNIQSQLKKFNKSHGKNPSFWQFLNKIYIIPYLN